VQASEILGISARHMRRLRRKLERWGMSAVMDQRGGRPRRKRIKAGTIELRQCATLGQPGCPARCNTHRPTPTQNPHFSARTPAAGESAGGKMLVTQSSTQAQREVT